MVLIAISSGLGRSRSAIASIASTINSRVPSWSLPSIQVRNATKKSSGSRTNDYNSAGRRLGAKKIEGELVKPGEILMRQRGTKFYPGENVGIGKDHTIFATEPGYVRFYLDPFHPKRKFVGVALAKDLTLPTPHFEPRVRRFGHAEVTDPKIAELIENAKSRKEEFAAPEIEAKLKEREEKRAERKSYFVSQLPKFVTLDEAEIEIASNRLLAIDRLLRGGKSIEDAQFYATFNHGYDLNLAIGRGEIGEAQAAEQKIIYEQTANKLDSSVSFDAHFNLCKFISESDKESLRVESFNKLTELAKVPFTKATKKSMTEIIESPWFDLSTQVRLAKKFTASWIPEAAVIIDPKDKTKVLTKHWDDEQRKVIVISKPKSELRLV